MFVLNTRQIDRSAQDFFRISIPPAWLIREQHPDIHIDYFVELADNSGPLGIIFGVQLKGTNSPDYSNGNIKISMRTKHLIYYLDKVKQPVFIAVVDVQNKKGYYLFIQKYLINLSNLTWRNRKTNAIKVKTDELLSNENEFKKAIINADAYMRDLWPSSIDAAINFEKKRLENLDPRFKISISHKDGQTQYGLYPKENVDVKCSIKITKELKKGIANYYIRGLPFSIKTSDILNIKGSDIITEAFNKSQYGKVFIGPTKQIDSSMVLSSLNKSSIETAVLYGINGFIVGGKREFHFQGQLNESPFKVSMIGRINKKMRLQSLQFKLNFEFKKWEGLSILQLPFFDRILLFFTALNEMDTIKMLCEIKGMPFLKGTSDDFDYEDIKPMYNYLDLIKKARVIAKDMNINLILPKTDSISKDDIENIELIYQILTKGECRQNGLGVKIKAKISPNDNFYKIIKESKNKALSESIMFEAKEARCNIFEKEINLGALRYILTKSQLLIDSSIKDNKFIRDNIIDIRVIGVENSELIISKVNDSQIRTS